TVLEFLKSKPKAKVLLIDAKNDILQGSSYNEYYKLHTDLHYAGDPENDVTASIHRGQHYLMSNSFFSKTNVFKICQKLKHIYESRVSLDGNEILGEPADFIKLLAEDAYPYIAKKIQCDNEQGIDTTERVVLGIETAESQINFTDFKEYLRGELSKHETLTLLTGCRVNSVTASNEIVGYDILLENNFDLEYKGEEQLKIKTQAVVVCVWKNIEKITRELRPLSAQKSDDVCQMRIKISILITLPEELRDMNTCIFFAGPHASITNQNDGTALLTYEPVMNVAIYPAGEEPSTDTEEGRRVNEVISTPLLSTEGIGQELAEGIREEVSRYIPAMDSAKILEVRVGFVRIYADNSNKCSIHDPNRAILRRREFGLTRLARCAYTLVGMKMSFTEQIAQMIVEALLNDWPSQKNSARMVKRLAEKIMRGNLNPEQLKSLSLILYSFHRDFLEKKLISFIYPITNFEGQNKFTHNYVEWVIKGLRKCQSAEELDLELDPKRFPGVSQEAKNPLIQQSQNVSGLFYGNKIAKTRSDQPIPEHFSLSKFDEKVEKMHDNNRKL
ncbi:MAG: hypothetical protein K2Q14_08700, partial [Gammaproteobacteria bacterium]|nr:hypothetical protein [Gammaproteobacteria bacterium]